MYLFIYFMDSSFNPLMYSWHILFSNNRCFRYE